MSAPLCEDCGARIGRANRRGTCTRCYATRLVIANGGTPRSVEWRARMRAAVEDKWIAREQCAMEGLDDEALAVFCDARDAGESMTAARAISLMDMEERGSLRLPPA